MLSELDDWMSDDGSDGDEDREGEDDDADEGNMKKKKKVQAKGRKQHGGLNIFFLKICIPVSIYNLMLYARKVCNCKVIRI